MAQKCRVDSYCHDFHARIIELAYLVCELELCSKFSAKMPFSYIHASVCIYLTICIQMQCIQLQKYLLNFQISADVAFRIELFNWFKSLCCVCVLCVYVRSYYFCRFVSLNRCKLVVECMSVLNENEFEFFFLSERILLVDFGVFVAFFNLFESQCDGW